MYNFSKVFDRVSRLILYWQKSDALNFLRTVIGEFANYSAVDVTCAF